MDTAPLSRTRNRRLGPMSRGVAALLVAARRSLGACFTARRAAVSAWSNAVRNPAMRPEAGQARPAPCAPWPPRRRRPVRQPYIVQRPHPQRIRFRPKRSGSVSIGAGRRNSFPHVCETLGITCGFLQLRDRARCPKPRHPRPAVLSQPSDQQLGLLIAAIGAARRHLLECVP